MDGLEGASPVATGELLGLLAQVRSVRRFGGPWLDEGDLAPLVRAASLVPCANNAQAVRLRLVCGPEACGRVFPHLRWAAQLRDWDGPEPGERPRGYVVACLPRGAKSAPARLLDVGIAAEAMALAARCESLACCMLRGFDDGLADDLGLPEGLVASLVLALGRPAERVELEPARPGAAPRYWRDAAGTHHVEKLSPDDLLA